MGKTLKLKSLVLLVFTRHHHLEWHTNLSIIDGYRHFFSSSNWSKNFTENLQTYSIADNVEGQTAMI